MCARLSENMCVVISLAFLCPHSLFVEANTHQLRNATQISLLSVFLSFPILRARRVDQISETNRYTEWGIVQKKEKKIGKNAKAKLP